MKQYGLPYKGSKSKLADRIMALFPKRRNFYDLFCGGCAMTHAAMLGHKFENVIANDINWMCPTLFADAIQGKYRDEKRWISREDFERLKGTDPYVAFVWSFGNNLRDYLYGKDIEPFKRALHYAIVFRDYEPMKELGHDLSFIDGIADERKRYIAVKHYFESGQNNPFSQSLQGAGKSAILNEPDTLKANGQSWLSAERISLIGGGISVGALSQDTKVSGDCNTANITMSYQTFVGGVIYPYIQVTIRMWRYSPTASFTATFPTAIRMSMTQTTALTTTDSTTGAKSRPNLCSSVHTICQATDSGASRSSATGAYSAQRRTIWSRSACSFRQIRRLKETFN